ncbi:MAG: acylphosphatase [Alphaproteobacteria bacterium]
MAAEKGETAVRLRIEGRVQGVGFRYWVLDQAHELGLDGWVRNRFDGSVEAVFAGRAETVHEMVRRCHDGPPMARVTAVHEAPEEGEVGPGFHAAPTV